MRILFFIEGLGSGGKERRMIELIKGLSKLPYIEMELVSLKKNLHYKDVLKTRIKIHYILRKKIKKDPLIFFQFYQIARKFKPDIIHVWGNMTATYAIPTKLILKIPMINNQITNAPLKVLKPFFKHRFTFPFSDRIIANTIKGLKIYNAPEYKSTVIYNGFNFDRLDDLEDKEIIKKKYNIKTRFVVGMTGHFSIKKDYDTYLRAANEILKTNRDVTFLCIGGGDFERFKKNTEQKEIQNILFLGKQDKVENIMNICDIGVLVSDSNVHGEGISNALLEFMALSKPVIATNSGGTSELVESQINGFLISNKDHEGLINKISFLLNNKLIMKRFGDQSRRIVVEKFNIKSMVESFLKEYEIVLSI